MNQFPQRSSDQRQNDYGEVPYLVKGGQGRDSAEVGEGLDALWVLFCCFAIGMIAYIIWLACGGSQ